MSEYMDQPLGRLLLLEYVFIALDQVNGGLQAFKVAGKRIQQSRVALTPSKQKNFSLLWQYYIKGKRRFSQLPT